MTVTDGKQLRVLVVDDEPDILEFYGHALSSGTELTEGAQLFEITSCSKGETAVAAVSEAIRSGRPYAVIFLDLKLAPGFDGVIAGEKIRGMDACVNIVVATGLPDVSLGEIARRIPPEDKLLYIQKPFHVQEIRQFASALGAKWQSEVLLRNTNERLERKVGELEKNRRTLMKNQRELENATQQLMETNNALSVLARNLERSRKESERKVFQRAVALMMPIVEKLQRDPRLKPFAIDLDLLGGYVRELTSGFSGHPNVGMLLSATEMRIASMIQNGMTSREIARHLYISLATVKTHRKNIRKKLDLRNTCINLRTYLVSEMPDDEQ